MRGARSHQTFWLYRKHLSNSLNVNFSRMKVLIQNPDSMLYLQDEDCWCADVGRAFDFGNSDNAIQFCVMHSISPVHVVLQWAGMPYSITIPIAAGHPAHPAKAARSRKHA
jgi:hypothetical protein